MRHSSYVAIFLKFIAQNLSNVVMIVGIGCSRDEKEKGCYEAKVLPLLV